MIEFEKARAIARSYVQDMSKSCGISLSVIDDLTIERDFGWVFVCDAVDAGDSDEPLAGNAPIIIDRRDGSVHETGTAYPIERYIENYEKHGSPHVE
jgi:hypothetical protein